MRSPNTVTAACLGAVVVATCGAMASAQAGTPGATASAVTPAMSLRQEFNAPFVGILSPDGKLRINGDWSGVGGNPILRANSRVANGRLTLRANATSSAEVQTIPRRLYGPGCYQTRLKSARPSGVVTSYFWIADGYDLPEVDIELLSKDRTATSGKLWATVHLADGTPRTTIVPLGFDPAAAFHTYAFAFTSTSVTWYVDGRVVKRLTGLPAGLGTGRPLTGYVMANAWTGNPWIGTPPTRDTFAAYDWMRGWEGATTCA